MDIESPRWDEWEERFMSLAESARKVDIKPDLRASKHYLCLNGDNGLTPDEEFQELALLESQQDALKKVEIETSYWQDIVLFIPNMPSEKAIPNY